MSRVDVIFINIGHSWSDDDILYVNLLGSVMLICELKPKISSNYLGVSVQTSHYCLSGLLSSWFQVIVLRPSHTAQNSRKRMNHAQILSLTWYISDLRISSVFLTWNLRSCAPMFAVSVLYAIPGFEQLKTRLRVKVCAVLRCFTYLLRSLRSPYEDNARNVRGISVIVCEHVAAIAFVDDFPLTISRHMTHVSRLLHLSITENHWKKYILAYVSLTEYVNKRM